MRLTNGQQQQQQHVGERHQENCTNVIKDEQRDCSLLKLKELGSFDTVLEPFVHQVGGHNVFLNFNDESICKPFDAHEFHFYKTVSGDLQPFTPKYNGLAKTKQCLDEDGNIFYVAKLLDESKVNFEGTLSNVTPDDERWDNIIIRRNSVSSTDGKSNMTHPWNLEALKRFNIKWKKHCYDQKIFMLLENVTTKYEKPCVLDLKIGFRSHGDNTNHAKALRKMERCKQTTSSQCGIRLCGMQTYHPITDSYEFLDKYFGRKIDIEKLSKALKGFFFDGQNYRIQLIEKSIEKITNLENILRNYENLRFYATSLLIVYDGNVTGKDTTSNQTKNLESDIDIRIIDFAHSSFPGISDEKFLELASTSHISSEFQNIINMDKVSNVTVNSNSLIHKGPDLGFIKSLENLRNMLLDVMKDKDEPYVIQHSSLP